MADLQKILAKAQSSPFQLWLLNLVMKRLIPFNSSHGIKISEVGPEYLTTKLPYRRSNLNHLKGLHACALATLAEFTMGVYMLNVLDLKSYRIIMKKLVMEYHFQGKTDAHATFAPTQKWLRENVLNPLAQDQQSIFTTEILVYDIQKNHLATGYATWQIKAWDKVKAK